MADHTPDEAFAQYVARTGMASGEQIEAARKLKPVPLAEALVRHGVITLAQRESVEKKLEEKREGAQQLGPYKLLRKLGEGGMGAVYLAEDTASHRRVAVKVLPKKHADNVEFVKRFRREVEAATRLNHPNIVRGLSAGEERGFSFYVMEYCEGGSLRARLERDRFLRPEDAIGIAIQVADGLKYAHEQGVVHRDIKPENVMITPEGVAKILDLGLSKNLDEADASFRTQTGAAIGTPHFISPEQARGQKDVDGRADIYSLGATLYTLVTGRTPFQGESIFEIINKHLTEQLPDPRDVRPEIPESVVHVIRRMMAKKPEDRHRDCGELLADLRLVQEGKSPSSPLIDAALSSIALPMEKTPSRWWPWIAGVAATVAILIVLTILTFGGSKKPRDEGTVKNDSKPPPGAAVDLLKLLDPARDHVNEPWRFEEGALISPASGDNGSSARFFIRYAVPEEYDLEIVAERRQGNEDLVLGLVCDGHQCGLALDGWARTALGCGFHVNGNWTRSRVGAVLHDGRANAILCSVRRSSLVVTVNGVRVLESNNPASLSLPPGNQVSDPKTIVVGSVRSVFRVSKLTLTPFKP